MKYGEVIQFSSSGVTYPEVSNHPDIFFCNVDEFLIYAPNTPLHIIDLLSDKGLSLIQGESIIGMKYPYSALFNAVVTDKYFIHNNKISDTSIKKAADKKEWISVNQGYTRCSLLPLSNDHFITSDNGIYKKLLTEKINVLFVDPNGIILPGTEHGFFGGTSGVIDDKIFITGSLYYYPEGNKVQEYVSEAGYKIIELYDGPLYDGGSILVFNI